MRSIRSTTSGAHRCSRLDCRAPCAPGYGFSCHEAGRKAPPYTADLLAAAPAFAASARVSSSATTAARAERRIRSRTDHVTLDEEVSQRGGRFGELRDADKLVR